MPQIHDMAAVDGREAVKQGNKICSYLVVASKTYY